MDALEPGGQERQGAEATEAPAPQRAGQGGVAEQGLVDHGELVPVLHQDQPGSLLLGSHSRQHTRSYFHFTLGFHCTNKTLGGLWKGLSLKMFERV